MAAKKIELDDLPARPTALDEEQADEVFGGAKGKKKVRRITKKGAGKGRPKPKKGPKKPLRRKPRKPRKPLPKPKRK